MRRTKNISLSIHSVTRQYPDVRCMLTPMKGTARKTALLADGEYARQGSNSNDCGMSETNLRDERYLPFEGAGVASGWKLELPASSHQVDYNTISDVILHVRFTSRLKMPMRESSSWERIIEESLNSLGSFLAESTWCGRENEVVNLFAHHFLMRHLGKGPFMDPSQIGIEVAVQQIPRAGGKKLVRKDLVLWNRPLETVWKDDAIKNLPAVILEWKTGKATRCDADIEWLLEYTKTYPDVHGYSVCAFLKDMRGVRFRKVSRGILA